MPCARAGEKRKKGELMASASRASRDRRAGPSKGLRHPRIKMFDSARSACTERQGDRALVDQEPGNRATTTYAQIVAEELGIPARTCSWKSGDTDTAPYGLAPMRAVDATSAAAARSPRADPRQGEENRGHLLEVSEAGSRVGAREISLRDRPDAKTIQECAFAAYTNHPRGWRRGLEAVHYSIRPTSLFLWQLHLRGGHRPRTGDVKVRRFVAVDDCATSSPDDRRRPDPRGLTQGIGPALYEEISYDDEGNISAAASSTTTCRRRLSIPHMWRPRPRRRTVVVEEAAAGDVPSSS